MICCHLDDFKKKIFWIGFLVLLNCYKCDWCEKNKMTDHWRTVIKSYTWIGPPLRIWSNEMKPNQIERHLSLEVSLFIWVLVFVFSLFGNGSVSFALTDIYRWTKGKTDRNWKAEEQGYNMCNSAFRTNSYSDGTGERLSSFSQPKGSWNGNKLV